MSKKYFTGLNYTLGNEDTNLEISLVKTLLPKSVLAICGSGGRSIPLAQSGVEQLSLVDLSREQIFLAKLREATYKQLSYDQFIDFWGYYPDDNDGHEALRKKIFAQLNLDESVRKFFENIFNEIDYSSLLYLGKWEQTFATLSKINQKILGKKFDSIFKYDNLTDQIEYFQNGFPLFRWYLVLFVLGNKTMFNALLYKGDFISKNYPESHFDYYRKAFNHLFTHDLASKSFFLQLCFFGRIMHLAGLPIESLEFTFNEIHNSKTRIDYHHEDFVTFLKNSEIKYDFLSISDVPSYFKGELEAEFMQEIKKSLNPRCHIVIRNYLRKPSCNLNGFIDVTHEFKKLIEDEKVQMYRIQILKFQPDN